MAHEEWCLLTSRSRHASLNDEGRMLSDAPKASARGSHCSILAKGVPGFFRGYNFPAVGAGPNGCDD